MIQVTQGLESHTYGPAAVFRATHALLPFHAAHPLKRVVEVVVVVGNLFSSKKMKNGKKTHIGWSTKIVTCGKEQITK